MQKYLVPILDLEAPLSLCHLSPSNTSVFLSDAATHPVVEILTMCFPCGVDAEIKAAVDAQFKEFVDKALRVPGLSKSAEASWTVEDDVAVPGLEAGGVKCTELVALITWKSIDDHMKNRELDAFKESIHLLRGLPELIKLDCVHVKTLTRLAKDVV